MGEKNIDLDRAKLEAPEKRAKTCHTVGACGIPKKNPNKNRERHKWVNYDTHLCSVFSVQQLPFLG